MDIERINENTLKLFITYSDIEDRGYSREEIWYNRSKGEELFWDVIGEINTEDYFDLEGPIWIHINASEQGLEVIVTRANLPDSDASATFGNDDQSQLANHIKDMEEVLFESLESELLEQGAANKTARFVFKDIDELIPVARRIAHKGFKSSLYRYENNYYLVLGVNEHLDQKDLKDTGAIVKEYIKQSAVTIHRLEEYGQLIMEEDSLEQVISYFN